MAKKIVFTGIGDTVELEVRNTDDSMVILQVSDPMETAAWNTIQLDYKDVQELINVLSEIVKDR